jgi:hypothetical protein
MVDILITGSRPIKWIRLNVNFGQSRAVLEDIVSGVFIPVLAKHSKSFSLIDCVSTSRQ